MVAKKRLESVILDVFFSLLLAFFLGSYNRLLVIQVACWAYAPKKVVKLAQNYVLNSKHHLTSFYSNNCK